ncbi:MAG: SPOR domain-containing protein [bacterium]
MRRMDMQYAISVSVGALLGVGLFFLLAPRLQPPPVTPAASIPPLASGGWTRIDVNDPPPAPQVAVEDRLDVPRAVVRSAKPAAPVHQQWAEFRMQERRALAPPQRRVNSQRQLNTPRRVHIERRVNPRPKLGAAERVPAATPPTPAPPAPVIAPPPNPLPNDEAPRYIVQVGPVAGEDRAAEIVRQLALAGFLARLASTQQPGPAHYQVVSETVPVAVAERRMVVLTQLGFRPQLRILAGGFAQLRFGAFTSQHDAELLAERVRTTGYAFAAVVREGGTAYLITLGPHREDTVESIQAFLRTRFRWMLPVTVSPAS